VVLLGLAAPDWASGGAVDVSEATTDEVRVTMDFETGVVGFGIPETLSVSEVGAADVLDGVVDVLTEARLVVEDSDAELLELPVEEDAEADDDADELAAEEEDADTEAVWDALPDEVGWSLGTAAPAPATGMIVRTLS